MLLLAPLALAGSAVSVGGEAVGAVKEFTGWVGGLFGGRPDWFADAAAGKLAPCPNAITPRPGEIRPEMASVTHIRPDELLAALQSAPRGTPGAVGPGGLNDPTKGTVEGLRTVLLYGHKELAPYITNLGALANAAAYTAHGTYNCDTPNWSNVGAAEHAAWLVYNHRRRAQTSQTMQAAAGIAGSAAQAVSGATGLPVQQLLLAAGAFLLFRKVF